MRKETRLMGNGRRGRGEGSIYRRKDGRWVGQYDLCTDLGKKTKYIYGKTRKEVATKLTKAMADRDAGMVFEAGSLNVGDYLNRWLDSIRDTLRRRTWIRHEEVVRLHLKPSLGNTKLDRLSALRSSPSIAQSSIPDFLPGRYRSSMPPCIKLSSR